MNIPMLPQDKANHALYGALAALIVGTTASAYGFPRETAALVGLAAAVTLGVLKEAADYVSNRQAVEQGLPPPHGVDLTDALATATGGALCWAAVALIAPGG